MNILDREKVHVIDRDATQDYYVNGAVHPGHRIHDLLIGGVARPIKFEFGKPVELPRGVAVALASRASNFVITDEAGDPIEFKPAPAKDTTSALAADETIARYEELTVEALLLRCNQVPGGDGFKRADGKQAMIDFLKARRKINLEPDGDDPDMVLKVGAEAA